MSGEHSIQVAIVGYLDRVLPGSYRAFAIPNGGRRDKITGAILKREGVKAGVPDIAIVRDGGSVAFLEVKAPKGSLSTSQKAFRDWCGENSVPFEVVRSIDDVRSTLSAWGINTREAA